MRKVKVQKAKMTLELPKVAPPGHGVCNRCKTRPAAEPSPCPYQEDVNEQTVMCNCCHECRYQCAQDI